MKKFYFEIFLVVFILSFIYFIVHDVKAGLVSNFSDQVSSHVISGGVNHTMNFIISSEIGPDDTLELYFETGFDLSLVDYTDIDFADDGSDLDLSSAPGSGASSNIGVLVSGQTITFTQNDTDTISADSLITIQIGDNADYQVQGDNQIYNPSTANTYKISLSGSFGDMGTVALIILETDSVALEAQIPPEISYILRNSSDSGAFSGCLLSAITSLGVSQCSYRIAAETNAINGFRIYVSSDGDFRNSLDTISNIEEDNQVTQGVEGYGIALTPGTNLTAEGDFSDNDTAISSTDTLLIKSNSVYNYIEGNLNTSTLITHRVSVDGTTSAGNYGQQITYSIVGNF